MKSSKGAAAALIAVGALGVGSIADAATSKKTTTTTKARTTQRAGNSAETALTGDSLTKASDAAKAAVPGGTVERATTEDPSEGTGAAYEVHVHKSDGSEVEVLLDSSYKVVKTQAAPQHRGGRGGPGAGPANEPELTGDDLTKATAAAKDAVPGGTVERASKEDAAEGTGAAYEVHVR